MESRSVANLTTEQLYRKRAFDRENQRASRARKKTRIAELEDEVADLKRRLARSEEQVKRAQSSEAALREVISSARSSLQRADVASPDPSSMLSPPSSTPLSCVADDRLVLAGLETTSPLSDYGFLNNERPVTTSIDSDITAQLGLEVEPASNHNVEHVVFEYGNNALTFGLPAVPDFDTMSYFWGYVFPNGSMPSTPFSGPFLDTLPGSSSSWTIPLDLETPHDQQLMRQWERVPPNLDPSCRLDTVLLELLLSSRRCSQKIPEFSGPVFPSIGSLLNPDTGTEYSPISNAIGQHGRVTMEVSSLELKIAIMYNMCVYLRWLITPTKQNYEAMPEYLRPLEIQLTIPHPAWIDVVVWPRAREQIIRHMDWSEFEIFRAISNHDSSINWPGGLSTVFTADAEGKDLRINPSFENHIRTLENWTIGTKVQQRFPFLKEYNAKSEETT
ncbi:hypothetical protein K504DRAFT_491325 [Pleomassaria siparia CBS 279.74]|uniref:BZIP domain-containing protein n=1 Tax=Pleomassaria siparia CBS 279.74 TaxID=1314801 RepID=A0A6G1K862_9PLEO|nr:hypothetical protein K504DRAFT_491325 [Pleomassaria siparia CBS 279.74]